MKYRFLLNTALIFLFSCSTIDTQNDKLIFPDWLKIGAPIPETLVNESLASESNDTLLTLQFFFSNTFYESYQFNIDSVAVELLSPSNLDRTNDTRLIHAIIVRETGISVDGIHIGMTYEDIKDKVDPEKIISIGGFGHFIRLSSGWNAILFKGLSLGEELTDETTVHALAIGGKTSLLNDLQGKQLQFTPALTRLSE